MSRAAQAELLDLAKAHDIIVLSDEIYRLLEHDETIRLPAICDAYAKGISSVALSKAWGGCGITVGWLACPSLEIRQKLVDVQYFGTSCVSRASEIQALLALRARDSILARNREIIRHNLGLLTEFMEKYAEWFAWVPPTAGAIAFLQFKGPWTTERLGEELAKDSISIKPAYCFTDAVSNENDYFRVGVGEKIKFPEALKAFDSFVQRHEADWRTSS